MAVVGASASGSPARHRPRVLPLTHAFAILRDARVADITPGPAEPLAGSISVVFAASNSDGSQLFVSTQSDGDICLIDQEPQNAETTGSGAARTGVMSVGCSSAADAEEQGGVLISPATSTLPAVAAALVPNGVTSVTFELANGTEVVTPVTNNVAWYASSQLVTVRFTIPGSGTITTGTTPASVQPATPASSAP
jgi:hypothetical protein